MAIVYCGGARMWLLDSTVATPKLLAPYPLCVSVHVYVQPGMHLKNWT